LGFSHDVASALNQKCAVDDIFLDFSKAFDRVPHHTLLKKMIDMGIDINIVCWVENYLKDRKQFVVIDGAHVSGLRDVTSGVPQGSVLAPVLFLIFINDLVKDIKSSARLFADDCVLYNENNSMQATTKLQDDISKIAQWCGVNGMSLNISKTKMLRFGSVYCELPCHYELNGVGIENVDKFKYLGVTFTSNFSFSTHIENIVLKALCTLYFLMRKLRFATRKIKELAYLTYVRPVLEYACVVWSPFLTSDIHKLEMVQRRAARFVVNNFRRYSSVSNILCTLSWDSLESRRIFLSLKLLFQIFNQRTSIDASSILLSPSYISARLDHCKKIQNIPSRIDLHKHSFFPRSIRLWNSLPSCVISTDDEASFERGYWSWIREQN